MRALARLEAETYGYHRDADAVWLSLLSSTVTRAGYAAHLARAYGFEQPLEAALLYTSHVTSMLAPRQRAPLLGCDLVTLREPSPAARCWIAPFTSVAQAFGWLYVVERSARLLSMVCGNVNASHPELQPATLYLDDSTALGRWRALGLSLDRITRTPRIEDQLVSAAHTAFHTVIDWYCTRPQDLRLGA
jgi:heme oxygenase